MPRELECTETKALVIPPVNPAAGEEIAGEFNPSARAAKTVTLGKARAKVGGSNQPNVEALKAREKGSGASVSSFHAITAGEDDGEPLDPASDFRRRVIRLCRYDGYKIRPGWKWSTRGLSRKELEEKVSEAILQVLHSTKGFETANSVEELVQCQAFNDLDCVDTSWDARDEDSEVLKGIVEWLIENNGGYKAPTGKKVRFANGKTVEFVKNSCPDVRSGLASLMTTPRKGILKNWTPPQEPFGKALLDDSKTALQQHDDLIETRLEAAKRNKFLNGVGYKQFEDAVVREKIRERVAGEVGARHERGITIVSSLQSFHKRFKAVMSLDEKIEKFAKSGHEPSSNEDFDKVIRYCEKALHKIKHAGIYYIRIGKRKSEMDAFHSAGFDKNQLLSEQRGVKADIDFAWKTVTENNQKLQECKDRISKKLEKYRTLYDESFLSQVSTAEQNQSNGRSKSRPLAAHA